MKRLTFCLVSCVLLAACQSNPNIENLRADNATLAAKLKDTREQMTALEAEHKIMASDNIELKRVMAILDKEKTSRTKENAELRSQTRASTQSLIEQLKDFLVQSNLLDYVGEELVARSLMDIDPLVLVDLENSVPKAGNLMGVFGDFAQATRLHVNVLRPLGDRFIVVWQSSELSVVKGGLQRIAFPNAVGVERGDIIAYAFPASVGVKYDRGTGRTVLSKKLFELGQSLDLGDFKAEQEKRAYSIGVTGILQ
ncbi:MAG: hypothetical protein K6L76_14165 [Agarilytica sp.]